MNYEFKWLWIIWNLIYLKTELFENTLETHWKYKHWKYLFTSSLLWYLSRLNTLLFIYKCVQSDKLEKNGIVCFRDISEQSEALDMRIYI